MTELHKQAAEAAASAKTAAEAAASAKTVTLLLTYS